MAFKDLIKSYRERNVLNKSEVARRIFVTPTYYAELEVVRRPPPTPDLCAKIAVALNLNPSERKSLLDAAMKERLSSSALEWVEERQKLLDTISPDILEALQDPVAVKALLTTFKNKKEIKEALYKIIEIVPKMEANKRKALLALCG